MNILTKLNIRQKVMLALTILAALFLVWQIYNFIHGSTTPSLSSTATPTSASAQSPAAANTALTPSIVQQPPSHNLANATLTNQQRQYLNLVREYQMTKMRRQILEEEASLANAQKRIAETGMGGVTTEVSDSFGGATEGGYQLSYLDRQAGQWTATVAQGDQYKEVHIGSRLMDGARVIAINDHGVLIQLGHGKTKMISFQGSVNVDNTPVTTPKAKPAAQPSAPAAAQSAVNEAPAQQASLPTQTKPVPPNQAKIAKMLGITARPVPTRAIPRAPVSAPVAPAASPAANNASAETASPTAPASTAPEQSAAPEQPPAQSSLSSQGVPVSVKELRESVGQISWREAADLEAAAAASSSTN
jgi:hypothetical protein